MIVRRTDNPGVMDGLIAFLDRTDPTIRSAALLLIDDFAANSRTAPRETRPDDPQLKEKWVKWWRGAQGAYRPLDEEEPRIIPLTLITGLDALPRDGRFERSRFMVLTNEIVDCCRGLRSVSYTHLTLPTIYSV